MGMAEPLALLAWTTRLPVAVNTAEPSMMTRTATPDRLVLAALFQVDANPDAVLVLAKPEAIPLYWIMNVARPELKAGDVTANCGVPVAPPGV
jgi:hypothetical protein